MLLRSYSFAGDIFRIQFMTAFGVLNVDAERKV